MPTSRRPHQTVYAVANVAGSCGKTTTAVNLAIALAAQGVRVRLIDLDPQANGSTQLGYPGRTADVTIADVLREQASINDAERPARVRVEIDYSTGKPIYSDDPDSLIANLTIVPAVRSTLDQVTIELNSAGLEGIMRLRDALENATPADVTLIDSPGTMSVLVTNALIATTVEKEPPAGSWGVITCTKPAGKEAEGIQELVKQLSILKRRVQLDVPLLAIVPCAVPERGLVYQDQLGYLKDGFGELVTPVVRRSAIVDEAYSDYLPVSLIGYRAKPIISDYSEVLTHLHKQGLFRPAAVNA